MPASVGTKFQSLIEIRQAVTRVAHRVRNKFTGAMAASQPERE